MRKLVLRMTMSIDGFMAGPNKEIDWLFKTAEDENDELIETISKADVHIMGSRTFQDMLSYWPVSSDAVARPMNEIPKVVFSKKDLATLLKAEDKSPSLKDAVKADEAKGISPLKNASPAADSWKHAVVASGDLSAELLKLKHQPGNIILAHGGVSFAQSLVRSGLVDEYWLVIHPVILGKGLPFLTEVKEPTFLKLKDSTVSSKGIITNIYSAHS